MIITPPRDIHDTLSREGQRVFLSAARPLPGLDPAHLFGRLYAGKPHAFLFESGQGPLATARYTLMGAGGPRKIELRDGGCRIVEADGTARQTTAEDGLALLDFELEAESGYAPPHFAGGWVGFIGYEAGGLFETLPAPRPDELGLPDLLFFEVTRLLVYDHKEGVLKALLTPARAETGNDYDSHLLELKETWAAIDAALASPASNGSPGFSPPAGAGANLSREEYISRVDRAKEYIEAGDIYQANLSQRFDAAFSGDAFELYRRLRTINPAPFSGYLAFPGAVLVSSSPERLVKVEGDAITTRPIAGTRPRGEDDHADRAYERELLLNDKERAEHLMLVDLERNDLGRLCEAGSVRVDELMFLEKYSHVHHIVSNIEGRLKPGARVRDILAAVFPGGTITGCPKIRCIEIIHELEPTRRGPYSGSLGYIGFNRRMDLNIIIRTLLVKGDRVYFHTGAGIVADSEPEKEYQETLDTAAALFKALGAGERP